MKDKPGSNMTLRKLLGNQDVRLQGVEAGQRAPTLSLGCLSPTEPKPHKTHSFDWVVRGEKLVAIAVKTRESGSETRLLAPEKPASGKAEKTSTTCLNQSFPRTEQVCSCTVPPQHRRNYSITHQISLSHSPMQGCQTIQAFAIPNP